MDIVRSYKDLCNEIDIWKLRIEAYIAEYKAIANMAKLNGPSHITGIDYSQPHVKTSGQMGTEQALIRMGKIRSHIILHTETIERLEKAKKQMEERIKKFEGLDKKVVYMRDIEGKTLTQIAEELGYSHDYIKEVSARNKRTHF